jgi:hypothetical protein
MAYRWPSPDWAVYHISDYRYNPEGRNMHRIRFSIASVLGVILVLGVGIAALRESTDLWESGLFTVTVGVLLLSVLLAIHRREARRAFWMGFALFGWTYLLFSMLPSIEPRLLTTTALAYLNARAPATPVVITGQAWGDVTNGPNIQAVSFTSPSVKVDVAPSGGQGGVLLSYDVRKLLFAGGGTPENFMRIGHSLFALLASLLGGLLSQRLSRQEARHSGATEASPSAENSGTAQHA